MNKNVFWLLLSTIFFISSCGEKVYKAKIETEYGNIIVELFNDTPLHRDNFVKLAKENFYEDLLFHRVMNDFMIQGGDPRSKEATPEQRLGSGGPGYQIPQEINHLHYRGMLAAARKGSGNPEKESSGSQFYIVHGKKQLTEEEIKYHSQSSGREYTLEEISKYLELGGYPSLDNEYTVFGKVIEGMDVVDKIAEVQIKAFARPLEDIRMKVRIIR